MLYLRVALAVLGLLQVVGVQAQQWQPLSVTANGDSAYLAADRTEQPGPGVYRVWIRTKNAVPYTEGVGASAARTLSLSRVASGQERRDGRILTVCLDNSGTGP